LTTLDLCGDNVVIFVVKTYKNAKNPMGNSPTDKSKDFIKSGMTLITQIESEKYLKKVKSKKDDNNRDK